MTTTVTLDPDVEALLQQVMREKGLSFDDALNQSVRSGIGTSVKPAPAQPFKQQTYAMGRPKLPLDCALGLADALGDEDLIRKMQLGK